MFNNSTRKHSLRKSDHIKEIHPFKKTEVHKRKLEIMGKYQILDLAAILTLNDLYYIME